MDRIKDYLKTNNLIDKNNPSTNDECLNLFYNYFIDKQNESNEANQKHQNELNELEKYIQMVRQFTDERENITIEYEEENSKLKAQIKFLEENKVYADDDLSEGTIEMLVEEGFGHVVSVPNHERIAVLLAERARLVIELDSYKTQENATSDEDDEIRGLEEDSMELLQNRSKHKQSAERLNKRLSNTDLSGGHGKVEELENEIEMLKTANRKLSKEIESYKQQQPQNDELVDRLKLEIENLEIKCKKYDDDNFNLKLELDKLYEEVDTYDKEISNLKVENQRIKDDYDNVLDEIDYLKSIKQHELVDKRKKIDDTEESASDSSDTSVKTVEKREDKEKKAENEKKAVIDEQVKEKAVAEELKQENDRLKQEIDVLNNELDELLLYKSRYERLNTDYENLRQKSVDNITTTTTTSGASVSSLLEQSQKRIGGSQQHLPTNGKGTAQMELDWIRRENEKILLENEQLQLKLGENKGTIEQLKVEMRQNDERMKNFIDIIDKSQYKPEEILILQKEIQRLNENMSATSENFDRIKDNYEAKIADLNEINENLWNKMKIYEENLQEQMNLVKLKELENETAQNDKETLLAQISEFEMSLNQLRFEIEDVRKDNGNYEDKLKHQHKSLNDLNKNLSDKQQEINALVNEKNHLASMKETNDKRLSEEINDLKEKNRNLNEQLSKLRKESSDMNLTIKDKEQTIRKFEGELTKLNSKIEYESRDKLDAFEKIKNFEHTIEVNWEKINMLNERLQVTENEKSKLEFKAKEHWDKVSMLNERLQLIESEKSKLEFRSKDYLLVEEHNKQLSQELKEKRETITRELELNSKLELKLLDLERQLSDVTQQRLTQVESLTNEIHTLKSNVLVKNEDYIKYKQEFENEKTIREKLEEKLNNFKDDFKKLKIKLKNLEEENNELQQELIEAKNQLKYAQFKHLEVTTTTSTIEKQASPHYDTKDSHMTTGNMNLHMNSNQNNNNNNGYNQQTIELIELRKKLEHFEMKCATYAHKFELLFKKYQDKKVKHKNKIQRLLDYIQREKVKYREMLANSQNELHRLKSSLEKESEFKVKTESNLQQIIEEKRNLLQSIIDKESKMREMKRENTVLNSKIKMLEEEMENLNDKIDTTLKERNRLRKDINMGVQPFSEPTSRSMSPTMSNSLSPLNYGPIGIDTMNNLIETKVNNKLWSTSATPNSYTSNWDKYKLLDPAQLRRRFNTTITSTTIPPAQSIKTITNAFDLTLNSFLGIGVNQNVNLIQQKSFR